MQDGLSVPGAAFQGDGRIGYLGVEGAQFVADVILDGAKGLRTRIPGCGCRQRQ